MNIQILSQNGILVARSLRSVELWDRITRWSMYVLLASLTFSKALVEIAFAVGIISWLIKKVCEKDSPVPFSSLSLLLWTFVSCSALSMLPSEHLYTSFRGLLKILEQVAVFFMMADTFRKRDDWIRLVKVLVLVMFVTCLDGVWQLSFKRDFLRGFPLLYVWRHPRITAGLGLPGFLGTFLIAWIPIVLSLLLSKREFKYKEKTFLFWLSALALTCLFYTHSRGAWLAFFASLFVLAWLKRKWWIIAIGTATLAILVVALPQSAILHRDAGGEEQSVRERLLLWERAIDCIKAKPILGIGLNTYARDHAKYDTKQDEHVRAYYAHNGYLQMAAESGLITLFFFLAFLVRYIYLGWQHVRGRSENDGQMVLKGVLTGVVAIALIACVDTTLHNLQPSLLFWFLLGFGWALMRGERVYEI